MATFQSPNSETMALPGAYAKVARARQSAMISQIHVGGGPVRSGLGDVGQNTGDQDTVTVSVREAQRFLLSAGYSVGSTGADGVYGSNTHHALERFAAAEGIAPVMIAPGMPGRMAIWPKRLWTQLQIRSIERTEANARQARRRQVEPSLPDSSGGSTRVPAPMSPPAPSRGGWGWIGVAVAAAAVVGIGAVVMMRR